MIAPQTIWLTGLPCSGKTTVAKEIIKRHPAGGIHLDGDLVRESLNKDLGFSEEDRKENIRRVAAMAELLNKQGFHVVCSFVSPTKEIRDIIYDNITRVTLVLLDADVDVCTNRDVKGMYAQAAEGKLQNFTGVDGLYDYLDVKSKVDSAGQSVSSTADAVLNYVI